MHERRLIEVYIYELGKQKMRDNTRRFRYSQLLTRYNQLRELWGRKMREREEGPLDFRRRSAALREPMPPRGTHVQTSTSSYHHSSVVRYQCRAERLTRYVV